MHFLNDMPGHVLGRILSKTLLHPEVSPFGPLICQTIPWHSLKTYKQNLQVNEIVLQNYILIVYLFTFN